MHSYPAVATQELEIRTLRSQVLSEAQDLKISLGNICDNHVLCQGTEKALRRYQHRTAGEAVGLGDRANRGRPPAGSVPNTLQLPVLNLGISSHDLTGTKRKLCIWSNILTSRMGKTEGLRGRGAHEHHSGWPLSCFQSILNGCF